MRIATLTENFKDYARDIKLNLSTVLTEEGAPGLTSEQIWSVALACAYATKDKELVKVFEDDATDRCSSAHLEAAKGAVTIMAMNNVYYRFLHLSDNKEFAKMPTRLRMSVIGKPGVDKKDFELMALAVSAIGGCGSCINGHIRELMKVGVSMEGCQSAIRIAAVIAAAAQVQAIG